jgi:excisionase family DNA binding protein
MHIEFLSFTKSNIMEAKTMEEKLLTGDELCERLKVKKSFLYAPVRRKGPDAVPCVRLGKYLRYDMEAVKGWIERQNQAQG